MTAPLGFAIPIPAPFDEAYAMTTNALKEEGFGVLTSIDIQSAFREKLGVEFRKYLILGVCNPALAHRALSANPEAGLLLPCTVTVEATGERETVVRIANPEAMLQAGQFPPDGVMRDVAGEARSRLSRVVDRLAQPILANG